MGYRAKEEDCLDSINRQYKKHPQMQHKVRTSASEVIGNAAIGFYRGKQAGNHEAYMAIKKKFPKAAQAILDEFSMNKKGVITVKR